MKYGIVNLLSLDFLIEMINIATGTKRITLVNFAIVAILKQLFHLPEPLAIACAISCKLAPLKIPYCTSLNGIKGLSKTM